MNKDASILDLAAFAVHHAVIANQMGLSPKHFWDAYFLKDQVASAFSAAQLKLLRQMFLYSCESLTQAQIEEYVKELAPIVDHYSKRREVTA